MSLKTFASSKIGFDSKKRGLNVINSEKNGSIAASSFIVKRRKV